MVHVRASALYSRWTTVGGDNADSDVPIHQWTSGHFSTLPEQVVDGLEIDIDRMCADLTRQADFFTSRGSGYSMEHLTDFVVVISRYSPLSGSASTYIPTPAWLHAKKCVVNVKNNDDKCFAWSTLASLHYVARENTHRVSRYVDKLKDLNLDGLSFPMPLNKIHVFEKNNPDIGVNVFGLGDKRGEYFVLYKSRFPGRAHCANLLLLENETGGPNHYVMISSLSRLVYGRSKARTKGHVCVNCLHVFSSELALQNHQSYCNLHVAQHIRYPTEEDGSVLKFTQIKKCH
jgi:hypothetical protein